MRSATVRAPSSPRPVGESFEHRFERLLADVSARFLNLPAAQFDAAISDSLRGFALLLGADRCQLIRFTPDEVLVTHSGATKGIAAVQPKSIGSDFPWLFAKVRKGQSVATPRVADLPARAAVDRASWQRTGAQSNLTVPLRVAGRIDGALTFGCLRFERDWPAALVDHVESLAAVLANALEHKRTRESLDAAIDFEQNVSDILAALLAAGDGDAGRVIEAGLESMARAFGAERATLWQRATPSGAFEKQHRWLAPGVPAPPEEAEGRDMPWLSRQLARGQLVRFARLDELTGEAAADLPGLRTLHIRAALVVPLSVGGAVVGALAFAASTTDRDWPDALVPRVRLVGEMFASVLARRAAEARESEAQAQAAHAARVGTMGVLAASLVHELTQPLAASLANAETAAELLATAVPDIDELRATVGDIVGDGRRVAELIQQLRRFLRRGEVDRSALSLRPLLDEALQLVAIAATDKHIALALDVPDGLPRFAGDRVQIQQLLLNLLLNAIDALDTTPPHLRRIGVVARPSAAGLSVEIADNGCGMDKATLARVFQPFFSTKPAGMGLGLAIGRSIVASHAGTMNVRSTLGEGTVFRLELPAYAPEAASMAVPRLAPTARSEGSVFVVDDDASMRRALARQLQRAGYQVEVFDSAQAYLDRASPSGAACIVSDVRMPGQSGLDLLQTLTQAGRELPTVFISGHGDIPIAVQAMRAGAVSFLPKPFTQAELLGAVAEALARGQALQASRVDQAALRGRLEKLTAREHEVFLLVVKGRLNKLIGAELGIAEKTVKVHRGRVMEKMGAASVADLVRMAWRL
jgi:FixJ family two-component response regulator/signal transduction histidine kinase